LSKSDLYGFVRRERNKNAKKEKEKLGKNWKKSKRLGFWFIFCYIAVYQ
jgi:hypothetical protein